MSSPRVPLSSRLKKKGRERTYTQKRVQPGTPGTQTARIEVIPTYRAYIVEEGPVASSANAPPVTIIAQQVQTLVDGKSGEIDFGDTRSVSDQVF